MGVCFKFVLYFALLVIGFVIYEMYKPIPMPKLDPNPWWKKGPQGTDNTDITKFQIRVPDKDLDDLRKRLELPLHMTPPLDNVNFTYGMNTVVLQEILEYWKSDYNWKLREKRLNSVPHYKTQIEGLVMHFIRIKPENVASDVQVKPLLLIHGWPGSVVEFYDIFSLLTTPQKDSKIVFEVIAPSLPGFGFSEGSQKPGLGQMQTAQIFAKLMIRLGFDKYYVQGGDWGSVVTQIMATFYPENVIGAHTNMFIMNNRWASLRHLIGAFLPSGFIMDASQEAKLYPVSKVMSTLARETGYYHIQATKPDTVGVSLNESPAGLAAYILEKFSTWTNQLNPSKPDGGLLEDFPISVDALLDNINVYWFTHSITTSMRYYSEFQSFLHTKLDEIPSDVPFGVSLFAEELFNFPPNFASLKFRNFVFFREHDAGGHFAAMECPKLLADDIISFVSEVEKQRHAQTKTEL